MKICFELSKEHTALAATEILCCLKAEKIPVNIETQTPDVFILSTNYPEKLLINMIRRLSQTFCINQHYFSSSTDDLNELKQKAAEFPIPLNGSIAIRYRNRSDNTSSQKIIQTLGEIYAKNRTVNLNQPDIQIRVVITNDTIYVGHLLETIDRSSFQKRKAHHRPFFSPISMHPLLARLLVNISQVSTNGYLIDPFCGTGGILIEAALMGINIFGADIEKKMITGTKKNLSSFGLKAHQLINTDIGNLSEHIDRKMDAVVTDLPYGKATTTQGETIHNLYKRTFKQIHSVLKPGGYAVIGMPTQSVVTNGTVYLTQKNCYPIRVHKSLTRYFAVYQK